MFLLVPAYPGCPGSKAVKRSLLLFSASEATATWRFTNFVLYYIVLYCCLSEIEVAGFHLNCGVFRDCVCVCVMMFIPL